MRQALCAQLFFALFILGSKGFSQVSENSKSAEYAAALCGPKPAVENREFEDHRLNNINSLMPPISNQTPASWCAVFSTRDLISYHDFTVAKRSDQSLSYEEFYRNNSRPSPIDLFALANAYGHGSDAVRLDTGVGINDLLYAVQDTGFKFRSERSIGFTSLVNDSPEAGIIAQRVLDRYDSKEAGASIWNFHYGHEPQKCQLRNKDQAMQVKSPAPRW